MYPWRLFPLKLLALCAAAIPYAVSEPRNNLTHKRASQKRRTLLAVLFLPPRRCYRGMTSCITAVPVMVLLLLLMMMSKVEEEEEEGRSSR